VAPLVLVGAGGFARETAEAVRAINQVRPTWELLGFLDDDPGRIGTEFDGVRVLGPVARAAEFPDARLVVCTGHPGNYFSRRLLVERLAMGPERYATLVHPAAVLAASVGPGTVALATAVATTAVRIGAHVAVMPGVVFTHDDIVGDYTTFGAGARLAGRVTVGEGTYVGAGALIREGITIGPWALIGMGAVVTTDVPSCEVWVGVPARRLRTVEVPFEVPFEVRSEVQE